MTTKERRKKRGEESLKRGRAPRFRRPGGKEADNSEKGASLTERAGGMALDRGRPVSLLEGERRLGRL